MVNILSETIKVQRQAISTLTQENSMPDIDRFLPDTRDFHSFDELLVHLKLHTCFVLPGLFSAIRSFKKIH